jgi:hypothetical protein
MIEAGEPSTGNKIRNGLSEGCPPHRTWHSWSHHLSPQALDVDWNLIRKYKGARALECGSPGPMIEAGESSTGVIAMILKLCPPHRGHSWSHHWNPHTFDID